MKKLKKIFKITCVICAILVLCFLQLLWTELILPKNATYGDVAKGGLIWCGLGAFAWLFMKALGSSDGLAGQIEQNAFLNEVMRNNGYPQDE